ncbi:MAG: ATP-binding protein [Oscillospiraceae bacterium]|nr:ATP-binding protein [Oscillospiraceae bacterium]
MKLTMKNIGVIRDAEIELDGITVLAGFNGTGKSTVSKALYGVIAPYVNLSEKILEERKKSIANLILFSFIAPAYGAGMPHGILETKQSKKLLDDLATKSRSIPEQYEEWLALFPSLREADSAQAKEVFPKFLEKLRNAVNRPDTEYVQYLAYEVLKPVFGAKINTIASPLPAEITLTAGKTTRHITIQENKVTACDGQEIHASRPVYLDTGHMLDGVNEYDGLDKSNKVPPYIGELYCLLKASDSRPTFEEYKSRERIQDMIVSVIHGKLILSSFGEFMFQDDNFNEPISLWNVAAGNKTFAFLQRLIENGALRANTILIIDEPESNQHPEWQLKLAETLVLLHKELGVRLFLTTHSTYFLRAIEVYSDRYELSSHCHYYQTQPVDGAENLFYVRNVDGQTKLIYHDFYMPFEEL